MNNLPGPASPDKAREKDSVHVGALDLIMNLLFFRKVCPVLLAQIRPTLSLSMKKNNQKPFKFDKVNSSHLPGPASPDKAQSYVINDIYNSVELVIKYTPPMSPIGCIVIICPVQLAQIRPEFCLKRHI